MNEIMKKRIIDYIPEQFRQWLPISQCKLNPAQLRHRIDMTYLVDAPLNSFELTLILRDFGKPDYGKQDIRSILYRLQSVIHDSPEWEQRLRRNYDWRQDILAGLAYAGAHIAKSTPHADIETYLKNISSAGSSQNCYRIYMSNTFEDAISMAILASISGLIQTSCFFDAGIVRDLMPLYLPRKGNLLRNMGYLSSYLQKQTAPDVSDAARIRLNLTALRYLLALCDMEKIPADFCAVERLQHDHI